jgi:hypothetical protein
MNTRSLMRLAPPVRNYAAAPAARRGCGIAAIQIKSVIAQEKRRIAAKSEKTMSRGERNRGATLASDNVEA